LIISIIIFALIIYLFYFFAEKTLSQFSFFSTPIFIPVDFILVRIIEVIVSLPVIILIISIAAVAKPSFTNLILIIGFIQWTSIARFVRAEMLRIRNAEFMQAAEVMGAKPIQIIFRHALPNTLSSALVSLSFGVAQAILIESSLSFLGIGLPANTVSWGLLINAGCENFQAWWLIIFPGLCIFTTVISFNILGEALRDAMDVKHIEN
jgi:peptide/nickel transport system permease protein